MPSIFDVFGVILREPFILIMRLFWGYQLLLAGMNKVDSFYSTIKYFGKIGIPQPFIGAGLCVFAETLCALFLMIGFNSGFSSFIVLINMIIALLFGHRDAIDKIFEDPKLMWNQPPILILITSIIVLCFGPGIFSIDYILRRIQQKTKTE